MHQLWTWRWRVKLADNIGWFSPVSYYLPAYLYRSFWAISNGYIRRKKKGAGWVSLGKYNTHKYRACLRFVQFLSKCAESECIFLHTLTEQSSTTVWITLSRLVLKPRERCLPGSPTAHVLKCVSVHSSVKNLTLVMLTLLLSQCSLYSRKLATVE